MGVGIAYGTVKSGPRVTFSPSPGVTRGGGKHLDSIAILLLFAFFTLLLFLLLPLCSSSFHSALPPSAFPFRSLLSYLLFLLLFPFAPFSAGSDQSTGVLLFSFYLVVSG